MLGFLAELPGLGRGGLLRLGVGVDLVVLGALINRRSLETLALPVVLHLGGYGRPSVPHLVLDMLLEVVDGYLFPDIVDVA